MLIFRDTESPVGRAGFGLIGREIRTGRQLGNCNDSGSPCAVRETAATLYSAMAGY